MWKHVYLAVTYKTSSLTVFIHGVIMRLFLLAVLLISVQNHSETNNPQRKASSTPSDKCQPAVVEVHTSCTPEAQTSQSQQQQAKPEVKPFMTHGEYVISGITAIYAFFSILTYFAIKQQGENAVRIERAWVDIWLIRKSGLDRLKVTNHGRTVAKISSWAIAPVTVSTNGVLGPPPERPREMLKREHLNHLITQQKSKVLESFVVSEYFRDDWEAIIASHKRAYFFISVGYEDTAGQPHATHACYTLSGGYGSITHVPERKEYT
jgi:hypothetical protein